MNRILRIVPALALVAAFGLGGCGPNYNKPDDRVGFRDTNNNGIDDRSETNRVGVSPTTDRYGVQPTASGTSRSTDYGVQGNRPGTSTTTTTSRTTGTTGTSATTPSSSSSYSTTPSSSYSTTPSSSTSTGTSPSTTTPSTTTPSTTTPSTTTPSTTTTPSSSTMPPSTSGQTSSTSTGMESRKVDKAVAVLTSKDGKQAGVVHFDDQGNGVHVKADLTLAGQQPQMMLAQDGDCSNPSALTSASMTTPAAGAKTTTETKTTSTSATTPSSSGVTAGSMGAGGQIGQIEVKNGKGSFDNTVSSLSMGGQDSIIGRAVVVKTSTQTYCGVVGISK